jgi:hypothetical protein
MATEGLPQVLKARSNLRKSNLKNTSCIIRIQDLLYHAHFAYAPSPLVNRNGRGSASERLIEIRALKSEHRNHNLEILGKKSNSGEY